MKKRTGSPGKADCVFLFGVVLLSALPYLFGLGFFSDDWAFQSTLAPLSGQGLGTILKVFFASDRNFVVRPVQAVLLVLEFKAFGRHALPYHVVCSMILGLVTVLLYLVLKELQAGRLLAFVIAAVYGLLPHYSTDRIWIASQQAVVCMAFALAGIYALLRSNRTQGQRPAVWAALGTLALVLSFLSYEVAFGLIAATLVLIGWRWYQGIRRSPRRGFAGLIGFTIAVPVLFAVGIVKSHFQDRVVYHHNLPRFLSHLGGMAWHALVQSLEFNFWTYGLHMPAVIVGLYRHSALTKAAAFLATVIAIAVTAFLWQCMDWTRMPSRRACLWLVVQGFVLFALGYVLFFRDVNGDFSVMGSNNRITIAAALGASFVLVAMVGLASSVLRTQVARVRAFSLAVGLICGVNCLVMSGIGYFWGDAWSRQTEILNSIVANVGTLPKGSVLLLDGFCRYSGPGIVFETDWDATGAIQIALGDYSLTSDVVSPNLSFDQDSVRTTMYGDAEGQYSYGNHLLVYNHRHRSLTALPSMEAAAAYVRAMNPTGDSGCPDARDGVGTKVD